MINEIIEKNKKKLILSYKQSQQEIYDIFEEKDDLFEILNNKLINLNNLSLNYYNEIENKYILLKNYVEESFDEINHLLNESEKITQLTFKDKYNEISKEVESIDSFVDSNEINIPLIYHISSSQNNEYFIEASIMSLIKKARLKLYLINI